MAHIYKKELAQKLRKEGLSIKEISQKIKSNKSTVSYWCRDILLTKEQLGRLQDKQKASGMKAILAVAEKKRKQRIEDTALHAERGAQDVGAITKRDLFILGLALYWGEGYKKGSAETGFTNSDPFIIKMILRWFIECYGIQKEDFILRVSINQLHEGRIDDVVHYWAQTANLPTEQFTKSSLIKTKSIKVYANHNQHFGTLRVKVRRGTNLRRRILGSLKHLENI
ncbi:MAG: hypothetical protein HYY92_02525 [Parcubacteria group bacterium]|nr:hypothetical protein [Parcubacteria group bacterium]